jgi:hypothetical protein
VKPRHVLLLLTLVSALFAGTLAPASAAAPDPVAGVTVDSQTQGAGHSWVVGASWTSSPNADSYRVAITDHDGYNTDGSYYVSKNTTALSATLSSDDLITGNTYWVTVRALTGSEDSLVTSQSFVAITLDTTAPTGAYKVDKPKVYLVGDDFDEDPAEAVVTLTQTALSDDTTTAATISRKVLAGDGSAAKTWTSGTTFKMHYTKAGNFSPKVQLTDSYGNTTLVVVPAVQVRRDTVGPRVAITRPANPGKVASWRRISGTSTDVGTGVDTTLAMVLEKRHGIWWAYDFRTRKFLKGFATLSKTFNKTRARPAAMSGNAAGTWRTPVLKGLTKGTLHIETFAYDKAFNGSRGPILNQQIS